MIDHDDVRFANFTRDLARRYRRRRSSSPPWAPADALEQLCGGSTIVISTSMVPTLPKEVSELDEAG